MGQLTFTNIHEPSGAAFSFGCLLVAASILGSFPCLYFSLTKCVGGCGNTGGGNGAMECPNIGVRGGTYNTVKLEKGEKSRAVRNYADVTREDVQTPLGQN